MPLKISTKTIKELRHWHDDGELNLSPDFQRRPVWNSAKKMLLIDSLARGIPVNALTFYAENTEDGIKHDVIDGKQRLSSIFEYFSDGFVPDSEIINEESEEEISLLVSKILKAKEINPENDTHALEKEIDSQVYVLYGLTAQETIIVEGKVHNTGLCNTSSDSKAEEVGAMNEDPIINGAQSFDVRAYEQELDCKKKKERISHIYKEDNSLRIDETAQNDVLCTIRQMFSEGLELTREEAFRKIAKELGYDRVGSKIEEILDSDIRTAVKRGILENERGLLKILCKTIDGYDRDFLKDQFLASIGRPWVEREEAVRAFTRFMGFRRAGEKIQDTVRSLINGLLREDRLESDGQMIRRKS